MKKYIKLFLAIIFTVVATSSCTDWLTVEPEGKLLKEDFWKSTEDVEAALAAMYNSLQGSTDENLIWGELRAGLHTVAISDYLKIAQSNITESNGKISWAHYYNTINLANTLMYYNKEVYGQDATFTKELMDQIDAEAMFVRALNHFYLVRLWKDVPLAQYPTISDTSNIFVAKSSEAKVLNFIIQDLIKAKDMASTDINQKGRANKYAIMSLLADVYLWNEQNEKAVEYCDSVMAAGYALEPKESWFNLYYPGNSSMESIFEIQFNQFLEEKNPIYTDLVSLSSTVLLSVDQTAVRQLVTGSDIRNCTSPNLDTPNPVRKYTLTNLDLGISRRSNVNEDANFIYYRYADIVLIKAEALNEIGGHEAEVNELLTLTKERAGATHTTIIDQSLLRTEILNERAREFLCEGKRWFDVLRFGKRNNYANQDLIINMLLERVNIQQQAILRSYVYNPLSYYLPIPDEDILYNPNLVQNEFYDK